jgi:hypothetical protein
MIVRTVSALALGAVLAAASPAWAAVDAKHCEPADIRALSGWDGIWLAEGLSSGLNGRARPGQEDFRDFVRLIGFDAPWNEEGRKRFMAAITSKPPGNGQQAWGFPVMWSAPTPFEITIGLAKTTITGEYRDIQVIYTDGRGHDPDAWPTIYGDSVGCWKGETLKFETTQVHYTPDYNAFAPTLSDDAVFEAKLHLAAPDRLEADFVITDPETLAKPWVVHMNYLRHKILDRVVIEGALLENDRIRQVGDQFTIEGTEGGLDDKPAGDSAGN